MKGFDFIKRTIAAAVRSSLAAIPALLVDAIGLAGAWTVAYGAWLAWKPAGFIVGGLMVLAAAWLLARRSS